MADTVLLLHGFGTSARRTWRDNGWIDLLTDAGRTVVAPDLLGHGDADKPHDPTAYAGLEDAVAEVLPPDPVDGIGFSLGARTLLVLAATRPGRFERLVVAGVGANLFRSDDPERIVAAIAADRPPEEPWAAYFHGLAHTPGNDPAALTACLRRPSGPDLAELVPRIEIPVLVVLGDADFAGPADPLLDRLPDATFVPLPGIDHAATPKSFAFLDAALAFLGAEP